MVTLIAILTVVGFSFFYFTSDRVKVEDGRRLQRWAHGKKTKAKAIGGVLLLISLFCCVWVFGVGAGVFTFLITVMTAASLVIIMAPLKVLSFRVLAWLTLFFAFTETIFF